MTLDEAIKMYTSNAEYERTHGSLQGCLEFRQLAEWLKDYKRLKEQEPMTEKVIKMRDATPEERESIAKYIKSISKPTGVDFWDLEQQPCDDAISRQAVLDLIADYDLSMGQVVKGVHDLPPVAPQPKTGHWIIIKSETSAVCSRCHKNNLFYGDFCKWCGTRMVEPQAESEEV